MEIIGTIIILLIFVSSGALFLHKKKRETAQMERETEAFYGQLDRQMNEHMHRNHAVVYAGGDSNSEIKVCDAVNVVSMPEGKRIRYE